VRLTFTIGMALIPGIANAHPDHSTGTYAVTHYLADPFHVGMISVGVVLVIAAARYVRSRSARMKRQPQ